MVVSSRCAGPQPKKPGERARFTFLGQSAAGRRMTAEDALEQPSESGSGRTSTLALRKTLSWTSVTPSCVSLDAWLAASGATSEVVWHQFDLLAGRRLWLDADEWMNRAGCCLGRRVGGPWNYVLDGAQMPQDEKTIFFWGGGSSAQESMVVISYRTMAERLRSHNNILM